MNGGESRALLDRRELAHGLQETLRSSNRRYYFTLLSSVAATIFGAGWAIFVVQSAAPIWPTGVALASSFALSLATGRQAGIVKRIRRQSEWADRSLARLTDDWAGSGDPGDDFRDPAHPYADDLGVFGDGSLHELLAPPSSTAVGRSVLADWLRTPAPAQTAMQRQAAVAELRDRLDVQLECCQLADSPAPCAVGLESLRSWVSISPPCRAWWFRPALLLLTLAGLAAAGMLLSGTVAAGSAWAALAAIGTAQALMCWKAREGVERTIAAVASTARAFRELERGARFLERQSFESPLLRSFQAALQSRAGLPASRLLAAFNRRITWLRARDSDAFILFSYLVAWGTQLSLSIDSWRIANGSDLLQWANAVGSFEALCALAAFSADQPRGTFPAFSSSTRPLFMADDLVHPLLAVGRAVGNPVRLDGTRRVLAISGSNMSGKSTYLRAIGLSWVLARCGAPVCAARAELSEFDLFVSAKTDESVHQRRSRFLSEASKLASALDAAKAGAPTLLLADEILSGTNSHDLRIGARAVVDQLVQLGGSAVATTHDVELAEAFASMPEAETSHFRDEVIGDALQFDYRLHPGIVRTSNALRWLRSLGVNV